MGEFGEPHCTIISNLQVANAAGRCSDGVDGTFVDIDIDIHERRQCFVSGLIEVNHAA